MSFLILHLIYLNFYNWINNTWEENNTRYAFGLINPERFWVDFRYASIEKARDEVVIEPFIKTISGMRKILSKLIFDFSIDWNSKIWILFPQCKICSFNGFLVKDFKSKAQLEAHRHVATPIDFFLIYTLFIDISICKIRN